MREGEEKKVTVKPADAYGETDPGVVTEVPKEMLPPDALTVGTELVATLFFDVKVLGIEPPKK